MTQFYKAKIFIKKEVDEKMVQEEVSPFENEVYNFANVITIENETKEDLKITTEWLDDRIINHARQLIKMKYKHTDGLQDPVLRRFATVE